MLKRTCVRVLTSYACRDCNRVDRVHVEPRDGLYGGHARLRTLLRQDIR